jgi:hypothetical protein
MMRAICIALVLSFAVGARAQSPVPPPAVPQLPDEPLPEWHQPPKRATALFLQLTPDMQDAQKMRQAGLWISAAGWVLLFGGGILYVWASSVNTDLGHPTPESSGIFDPSMEDRRNHIGQWKMTAHHKSHPNEPLPPLSGF